MSEKTDAELVAEFQSGNDSAFEEIVVRFQDRVYRMAMVWLHDSQLASDAAQEVFLRSFRGLRGFRFRSRPFTWLYRTTRLVCNEFNRKRPHAPLGEEPVDAAHGPERSARERQTADRIREMICQLPERQREVVLLRVFEDCSVAETAQLMGCREGTVKALYFKARQALRRQVPEEDLLQ